MACCNLLMKFTNCHMHVVNNDHAQAHTFMYNFAMTPAGLSHGIGVGVAASLGLVLLIVGAKLVYSKLIAPNRRRPLENKSSESLDSSAETKGDNGPLDESNQSFDDDALKATTTQTAAGVEYVNVSSTGTNQEQETYYNVDFLTKQANDTTGQNPADGRLAPPYEALTSSGRQRTSQAAESEYSELQMRGLANVL